MVIDYSRFDNIDTSGSEGDDDAAGHAGGGPQAMHMSFPLDGGGGGLDGPFGMPQMHSHNTRARNLAQGRPLPPAVEEMPVEEENAATPELVADESLKEVAERTWTTAFLPWLRASHDERVAATIRRYQDRNGGPTRRRLSAGPSHALVINDDGGVTCFGDDRYGHAPPEGIPASEGPFVAAAAGLYHSLLLRADGSVLALGSDEFGQAPRDLKGPYVDVAAGDHHSLLLNRDGTAEFYGIQGFVDSQSRNLGWQFGEDPAWLKKGGPFVAIECGNTYSVALRTDGSLVGWGDNSNGEAPVHMRGPFTYVSAGMLGTTLAIKEDGRLAAFGMGAPGGMFYSGDLDDMLADPGPFIAVASGVSHASALRKDGTLVEGTQKNPSATIAFGQNMGAREPMSGVEGRFIALDDGFGYTIALRDDGEAVIIGEIKDRSDLSSVDVIG